MSIVEIELLLIDWWSRWGGRVVVEKTQKLLTECAVEACNWGRDALEAEEEELLAEFKEQGMTITYLTDEQKEVFNAAIADWKAEMIEKFGKHACDAFGIK